jgi:hypothetical protein
LEKSHGKRNYQILGGEEIMDINTTVGLGVLSFFLGMGITGWIIENKSWNGGICPECQNLWEHFDNDSQGGRGYVCRKCSKYIWISWPWIDRVRP